MATKIEKLAASPETPLEVLLELVKKGAEIASNVISNPAINLTTLRKIFLLLQEEYRLEGAAVMVLESPCIDEAFILEIYSACPDIHSETGDDHPEENDYPVQLAKHPSTPAEIITKLAESPFYMVRERLAARGDLVNAVVLRLAKDPNVQVRRILATNSSVNAGILDLLAKDSDQTVLLKVALNSHTSTRALHMLAVNPNESIKFAALSSPAFQ